MMACLKNGFVIAGIFVCAVLSIVPFAYPGTYSGGSGTAEDPYIIGTPEQMNAIGANPPDWASHFVLMADLDMAVYTGTQYNRIGTAWNQLFTGTFDGNGHVIRNLTFTTTDSISQIGLFGAIGGGATIQNLGLEDVSISCVGSCVGGLVGYMNSGTITACYCTGTISCGTDGHLVGGLVGYIEIGTITSCYSTATIIGNGFVGGLVGRNYDGIVRSCYSAGPVSAIGFYIEGPFSVGGLTGGESRQVISCFWDIETSNQPGSGGGKGLTSVQMKNRSIFQNAGWEHAGWMIQDGVDYPRLAWQDTPGEPIGPASAIPLSGSGTAEVPYRVGTAAEFASLSWYAGILDKHIVLTSDIDLNGQPLNPIGDLGGFSGVLDGNQHTIFNAKIDRMGSDYVGLFGLIADGAQIRNLILANAQIGGRQYVGGLVGHSSGFLDHCSCFGTIAGNCRGGVLAGVNRGTIVSCLSSGSVGIGGYFSGGTAGGLAGVNSGIIRYSSSSAKVSGSYEVGGFIGYNRGELTYCTASGEVHGWGDGLSAGGFVGCTTGRISNCFSTGEVKGSAYYGGIGGFAGAITSGSIERCYSVGKITFKAYDPDFRSGGLIGRKESDTVSLSFWDTQTSGFNTSAGGTGKTTAEMMTLATFTDAGWDFVGESANGTADVWRMCGVGVDYPRLNWEFSGGGDMACPDGVAMEDLLYLAGRWMAGTPETAGAADATADGKVDLEDFAVLSAYWLTGNPRDIVSTFDTDAEGWLVVQVQSGYGLPVSGGAAPIWSAAGGIDGGGIGAEDWYAETFFSAPAAFLGNRSASFGKDLQFDIYISYTDNVNYPAVILHGATKNLFFVLQSTPVGVWTHRTIPLVGAGWQIHSWTGAAASDADMLEVLSDLQGLYINAEWRSGPDMTYLDNVTLAAGITE